MNRSDIEAAGPRLHIDHVLFAVDDFAAAAERLLDAHGLAAVEGGRHVGLGTANWIVPLGESYIELVGVVDPGAAATNAFGRRTQEALEHGGGPYAWCVVPDDFDATVTRLGLEARPGSRRRPDGQIVAWRMAGTDVGWTDSSRPFFLDWRIDPELHPGRMAAAHRVPVHGIAWVEVAGDEDRVREWLGDPAVPVRVVAGEPAVRTVGIATTDGEIVIRVV